MQLDPLTLPLRGLQVIEASAGTGKTYTLATLYVRLVLQGLTPAQILVMTFTQAATAELRARIRARLAQAARCFQHGVAPDDLLQALRASYNETRWPHCAHLLDQAAQCMDLAAIYTIHGWSKRMLQTHAFDSASLFQQERVQDSERLKLEATQDYWRKWFYPLTETQIGVLSSIAKTPDDLLAKLRRIWVQAELAPGPQPSEPVAPTQSCAEWATWQTRLQALDAQARAACTGDIIALLSDTIAAKQLKGYRADWPAKLASWAAGETLKLDALQRFALGTLQDKGWTQAENYLAFAHIETLCDHAQHEPDVASCLLAHAAFEVGAAYAKAKADTAQFDFSDLLQRLYHACHAPTGSLAETIRRQFPVALVDEFQDTDAWQYGTLSRIYADTSDTPTNGFIMIGDPKQAIYSFRGADLNTYLQARASAQGVYTLSGNYRSTAGVVAAVNHVFSQASAPFGDIPFEPVQACNPEVQPLAGSAAMTVWYLEQTGNKDVLMQTLAACFATQMVGLLNQGTAQAQDMAVLVRDRMEAAAIRQALLARGVRSVYLSERDSVYDTTTARDLWRILRAVANPRLGRLVRGALATPLWGLDWAALDRQLFDEVTMDALRERFHAWHQTWQHHGLLPMLYQLLHEQALPSRLLSRSDGERQLTNLLHLGELLQNASVGLQGPASLLRYFEMQLREPDASGENAQLRLESDAQLVRVITLHKSKGLQYLLVFLPFVSFFRAEKPDSSRDDAARMAEDIRLLYVAMTRAERALWLGVAPVKGDVAKGDAQGSALSNLLGRSSEDDLVSRLQTWASTDCTVEPVPTASDARYVMTQAQPQWRPALEPQRRITQRWWSASFSALTRELGHTPSERDERLQDAQIDNTQTLGDDASLPYNAFKAGASYGTLIHDLLEWQAKRAWPGVGAAHAVHADWQTLFERKAQSLNLDADAQALLQTWITAILQAPLPLPTCSAPLVLQQATHIWAEMGFTLPVTHLASTQLDQLIHTHVLPGQARAPLRGTQLQGMLTGFMDLVLEFEGRYYVLDYKSNKLPSYAELPMQQAILAHRYDVQYSLYLLALHRLLKNRLPNYDYEQHMGGALYLFLRGIDQPGNGLFVDRPSSALIDAMDAMFV